MSTYKRLDFNPSLQLVSLINDKLHFAFEADLLTKKEFGYLSVEDYNMPKYTDSLIKELVCDLPSYVRDTGDVLNKIADCAFLGYVLLVGIDVELLSMSIPREYGIAGVPFS